MSRNFSGAQFFASILVAPREGRVSRNDEKFELIEAEFVAPREGRVSRNLIGGGIGCGDFMSRPARGV